MIKERSRFITSVIVITFLLIAVLPQETSAQLNDEWKKTYGGTSDDVARSVIFTDDGDLMVAGYTRSFGEGKLNNYFIVKTNNNGYTKWRRTYGGSFDDEAEEIIPTDDGGFAIAGSSESFGGKAQYDFYLVKTDPDGKKEWDNDFGGRYDERCYSVNRTKDGGYIMAGSTITYGERGEDFWVVKTNETGRVEDGNKENWKRAYGGDGDDVCTSVIETKDGDYLLAGYTDSFGDPGQGAYLVKVNKTGDIVWERKHGGDYDDFLYDLTWSSDGGYVFVGSTTSFGKGEESFWMVKTDNEGYEEWSYASDGDYDEVAYSVEQSKNGNFFMTGYTSSYGKGGKDFWIVEISPDGEEVDKETFGGSGNEVAYSIAISSEHRIAIAGYTESFGAGGEDFWVVAIGKARKISLLWMGVITALIISIIFTVYTLNKRYRFV